MNNRLYPTITAGNNPLNATPFQSLNVRQEKSNGARTSTLYPAENNKEINKRIIRAKSTEDISEELDKYKTYINHVNLATAFNRLSKIIHGLDNVDENKLKPIVSKLESFGEKLIDDLELFELAQVLLGYNRIRHVTNKSLIDVKFMIQLLKRAELVVNSSAHESNFIRNTGDILRFIFTYDDVISPEMVKPLVDKIIQKVIATSYRAKSKIRDSAMFLDSLCACRQFNDQIFYVFYEPILHNLRYATSFELTQISSAYYRYLNQTSELKYCSHTGLAKAILSSANQCMQRNECVSMWDHAWIIFFCTECRLDSQEINSFVERTIEYWSRVMISKQATDNRNDDAAKYLLALGRLGYGVDKKTNPLITRLVKLALSPPTTNPNYLIDCVLGLTLMGTHTHLFPDIFDKIDNFRLNELNPVNANQLWIAVLYYNLNHVSNQYRFTQNSIEILTKLALKSRTDTNPSNIQSKVTECLNKLFAGSDIEVKNEVLIDNLPYSYDIVLNREDKDLLIIEVNGPKHFKGGTNRYTSRHLTKTIITEKYTGLPCININYQLLKELRSENEWFSFLKSFPPIDNLLRTSKPKIAKPMIEVAAAEVEESVGEVNSSENVAQAKSVEQAISIHRPSKESLSIHRQLSRIGPMLSATILIFLHLLTRTDL